MSKDKPVVPPKPKIVISGANGLDLSQSTLANSLVDLGIVICVNAEENGERICQTEEEALGISETPSSINGNISSSSPGGRSPRMGPKTPAKPAKRNTSNLELPLVMRSRSDSNSSSVSAADDASDVEQEMENQCVDEVSNSQTDATLVVTESISGQEVCLSVIPTPLIPHCPVKPPRLKKSKMFSVDDETTPEDGREIVLTNIVCDEKNMNDTESSDSVSVVVVDRKNLKTFPKPKARKNVTQKNCDSTVDCTKERSSATTSDADVNESEKIIITLSDEKALDENENDLVVSKPVLKDTRNILPVRCAPPPPSSSSKPKPLTIQKGSTNLTLSLHEEPKEEDLEDNVYLVPQNNGLTDEDTDSSKTYMNGPQVKTSYTSDKQDLQINRNVTLPPAPVVLPPPRTKKKHPTLDTNIPHPMSTSDINDASSSLASEDSSSNLDLFVPFPGQTLEDKVEENNAIYSASASSNVYSEIDECDELMDEQGYSIINDSVVVADSEYASVDTDYIYPENYLADGSESELRNNDLSKSGRDDPSDCHAKNNISSSSCLDVLRFPKQTSNVSLLSDEESSRSRSSSWICDSTIDDDGPSYSNVARSRSDTCPSNDEQKNKETAEVKQKTLEKKKKKAFLTAQELLTSEKTFVEVLRLLSEDFTAAISRECAILGKAVVAPGVVSQIIKYLPELQKFNEELLQDLTLRIENWDEDPRVADIFVKKGAFLKMYTNYIREFNTMVALLDETRRKNPEFDRIVTDFESSRCAKLALKHYMLKPIQRIPQYRMLLTDYRNQLFEDSPDFKDANMAILIVHEVAEHANQSMKFGDNLIRLLQIQNSLIGQFEVIVPGRVLLKEGILMKLSRKEMQPRMFFLFSDVVLYTTPVGSGFKLNNILPLSGMKVSNNPTKDDFQNEFNIISTQRSFTLSATSEQERMEWLTILDEAITAIKHKRSSYSQGKLTVPSIVSIDLDVTDFNLGTKAPVWIPDDRVSMCMICKEEFSLLFRRHHCRGCGKVICANCSSYEAPLQYLQYKPERVCSECFLELNRIINEMDDFIPDSMMPSTPGETMEENNRFSKQSIKSQFKCFAVSKSNQPKRSAVLHEVNANDDSAELSGYLYIWRDRKWKKTWFVLKEKVIYAFKASEDAAAEKSTPLLGYEITPFNTYFQGTESNLLFELCHRGMPSIIFKTESPQSRDRWMSAMRRSTMP